MSIRSTLAAAALLILALTLAAPAGAEPLASGKTTLTLSDGFFRQLKKHGVEIVQLRPAKVRGRVITLPVRGGQLESKSGAGRVNHRGGIGFRAGKRLVTLRDFSLDTVKRSLSAKLGGRRLIFAAASGLSSNRDGLGVDVFAKDLRLSEGAAAILRRKLGLPGVFASGRSLAASITGTQPAAVTVSSGTVSLALDPGFEAKLQSLEVTTAPFESATLLSGSPTTYSFAVVHGSLAPDLSSGVLVTATGLRLTQGDGSSAPRLLLAPLSLALDSRRVSSGFDARPSPPLAGPLGIAPLAAIGIAGGAVGVDSDGTVTMADTAATLEPYAADPLNEAFAKAKGKAPLFAAGEPFGSFAFTLQTG